MQAIRPLTTIAITLVIAACGQGSGSESASPTAAITVPPATASTAPTTAATAIPSVAPNPLASAVIDGAYAVDGTGRKLVIKCWGSGSPAVLLESGAGSIDELRGSKLVRNIAAETEVCLYNRAGLTPSDPAPNRKREAEDVAADFHALLQAARIKTPVVLFGRSFGGMIVTFYASTHPDDVAGVVVFDSPAPSATMTIDDFPEGVWNAPGSLEHLDVLYGFENRFGKQPVHFAAPLILVSTTEGESRPEDTYWLQTSDGSKQVVLTGGMEVINQQAAALANQVLTLVRAPRGT